MKLFNTVLSIVLLIAVVFLFIKLYGDDSNTKNPKPGKSEKEITENLQDQNFGDITIAWVSMDTLNEKYKLREEMSLKLEKKGTNLEATIAKRSRQLQEDAALFQKMAPSMNPQQLEENQRDLYMKEQEFQMMGQQMSQQLEEERSRLNKIVYDDLEEVLKSIRMEYDLDLIVKKNIGGDVLSANEDMDITSLVLKRLNDKYDAGKAAKEENKLTE